MNLGRPALFAGLFSLFVAFPSVWAQIAPPASDRPLGRPEDETVVLSPFVVNASQDSGYQASSTLAGTRLNTPVKDLGASISIYTKDFLTDIGATNTNELLIYATGMEAAGSGGNFSGATSDINSLQFTGDGPRSNPQTGSRTRGLAAPNFSRGFYTTDISSDSYNVETVTVNRGPNAILFGVGSPAGVVESTLLQPNLKRDKHKVEVRIGNNGSLRNSVDFNQVLLKDKLAVRIAALQDDEEFNQRPAFEDKRRLYGALTFEPYRSTALRMNFETGHANANRPITVLPFKSYSSYWEAAGRPGFDWTFYDDPARNPDARLTVNNAATEGAYFSQRNLFNPVALIFSRPDALTPDNAFRTSIPVTTSNAANAVKAQVFNAVLNRDLGNDMIRFIATNNVGELLAPFWVGDLVLPGQQPGYAPAGVKMQGYTDFEAFDFRNRMIDETSSQTESFHAFNAAFEQRGWEDRIGIELAYDIQRVDRRTKTGAFSQTNGNHIRIDPNVTLPTGVPNPNYGRPYVVAYSESSWRNNLSDRETKRATAFLKYDFNDLKAPWGKWLGRHTVTGLYEEAASMEISYQHRLASDGLASTVFNNAVNSFDRRAAAVIYLGPSIIGNSNPVQLEAIRVPVLQAGPVGIPATYFSRAGNATDPGALVTAPTSLVEVNNGGNASRDVIKSQAFLLQSYWLQDHLITMVGWRKDEDFFVTENAGFVANPANPNDPGKVHYNFDDFSFPNTPPFNVAAEVMTYSAVLRWPHKLLRLPSGLDLSVFYNESSNFTPSGGRVDAYNDPLASPVGETREYGVNFSAFHNKLIVRLNQFETKVFGASYRPSVFGTATYNGVIQLAELWGVEGNVNPHLVAMRQADTALLFSGLPANYAANYGFGITGTVPNLSPAGSVQLPGATDTTDFTAKGTEIEVVYNPIPNWRMLVNVAKQETVQSNSLPFLKQFMATMIPIWTQLRDRSRPSYSAGWQPGDPVTTETVGSWIDSRVLVPYATELATEGSVSAEQRKWRVNFVTNYTFGAGAPFNGKLKGVGIGAAVRWQDKLGIGYPSTRNPDGTVNIDLGNPYYAPAETNIDAWISYERKIWNNRIGWKVQLNVRNLFGSTDPIAIGVQPWGEVASARLAPERRWYLTNTFTF